MCSLSKLWERQVRTSTLGRMMKQFWKVHHKIEQIGNHRGEQLVFFKKTYKKKSPKRIVPSKVWLYGVERCNIFNPLVFDDEEKYFETLILWREREMEKFIEQNPRILIKQHRHKKVPSYKRPIRV